MPTTNNNMTWNVSHQDRAILDTSPVYPDTLQVCFVAGVVPDIRFRRIRLFLVVKDPSFFHRIFIKSGTVSRTNYGIFSKKSESALQELIYFFLPNFDWKISERIYRSLIKSQSCTVIIHYSHNSIIWYHAQSLR